MRGALNTDIGRGGSVCHRSCYIDRGLQILDRRPWIIHTFGKASLSLQHYDHYQATVIYFQNSVQLSPTMLLNFFHTGD